MSEMRFRIAELGAENQELHDENERLVEALNRILKSDSADDPMLELGLALLAAISLLAELKGE